VAVPMTAWLIVPLGLCAIILLPLNGLLAGWVADCAIGLAGAMGEFAAWVSGISWVSFTVTTPTVIQMALLYGIFLTLLKWRQGRTRWVLTAIAVLILTGWWVAGRLAPSLSDELEVTFLDVGQADAALVRFPCGKTLLVDGGDAREGGFDSGRMVVAPFLWSQGISRLDFVAVTHPQSDHAGGLASVARLFHPREIWTTQALDGNPVTLPLAMAARETGGREIRLTAGTRALSVCGCEVDVVWPPETATELDLNERSLVLRISHGDHSFLLTGDLEKDGEEGLLETDAVIRASVLKAGHHGSRNATSRKLLDRVEPAWAVISVGKENAYGLPHRELVARIEESGVRLLRTDRDGAVTFRTDGAELEVECYREADGVNCRK
jgi:competence protein ComEC